jgi:hypothetical protein
VVLLQIIGTGVGIIIVYMDRCWYDYSIHGQVLVLLQYIGTVVGMITVYRDRCWYYYSIHGQVLV